jgi:hypothetical protein
MAEDQGGQHGAAKDPWLKLFTAFKVALDPKKLLLASAGIVAMSLGWWLLSVVFYWFRPAPPQWKDYETTGDKTKAFETFKRDRDRWNLLHELAGTSPTSPKDAMRQDAADLSSSLEEFLTLDALLQELNRYQTPVTINIGAEESTFEIDRKNKYTFTSDKASLDKLRALEKPIVGQIQVVDADARKVSVAGIVVTLDKVGQLKELQEKYLDLPSRSPVQLAQNVGKSAIETKALALFQNKTPIKPFGRLRSLPWSEYRGPNPFLLVTGDATLPGPEHPRPLSFHDQTFLAWFFGEEVAVLLEPLTKFLEPIKNFFKPAGGGWNRIYLMFVMLWSLAVWGFFGGAISRMAVVQVARHNEKISLREALQFARGRCQSFFFAPLLPLVFLAVIAILLMLYGLVEGLLPWVGDVVIAGLLFPLVLIAGLVMAVVLVGLLGYPLMYPTISAEGSDAFDALSRSYSYVYQAPWNYIWYSAVSIAYGAVLVFFVGIMGSMLVYLGKWGMSESWYPESREPSYLFAYAPTSFGWRDLLLHKTPHVEAQEQVLSNGRIAETYYFKKDYAQDISFFNRIGAGLIMLWLWLIFLFVVGFGYSYFWTAASIIYLLMRRKVDDTEMDEIYLEEEETLPSTPPVAPTSQQGTVTMVEAPTLRTPQAATENTGSHPPGGDTNPTPSAPNEPPRYQSPDSPAQPESGTS